MIHPFGSSAPCIWTIHVVNIDEQVNEENNSNNNNTNTRETARWRERHTHTHTHNQPFSTFSLVISMIHMHKHGVGRTHLCTNSLQIQFHFVMK
mmetsp:Transcript_24017/g.37018  ORF Transcript_24017/g.37018 Transcript_24017/m.37018 type:complete len:94 (-) Transcript_24017:748-1029(-)